MPHPYILAETNWKTVSSTEYDVAILPWGATEAHNYHLPYATDVMECDAVAAESAARMGSRRESHRAADRPVRRQHGAARHRALPQHEPEHPGGIAARSGERAGRAGNPQARRPQRARRQRFQADDPR